MGQFHVRQSGWCQAHLFSHVILFKQSGSCANIVKHFKLNKLASNGNVKKGVMFCLFDQVLDLLTEPGGFPHELHEVNHQPALPSLPVYRSLRFTWHAVVWWKVRT